MLIELHLGQGIGCSLGGLTIVPAPFFSETPPLLIKLGLLLAFEMLVIFDDGVNSSAGLFTTISCSKEHMKILESSFILNLSALTKDVFDGSKKHKVRSVPFLFHFLVNQLT